MTINLKNLCVALVFVIIAPFQAAADEVADVVNGVAAKLVQQLPMDKKIALKSLSPDDTGLPEDFLRMLTAELAASLLKASNFQLKLMNKFTTEELWEEAIEFGDADFDVLYESSQSDVMVMLSPRLSRKGLSFSVDAYRLTGNNAGTLLASSGLIQLNIDVEKELGIDITTLDDSISSIDKKVDSLEQLLLSDRDLSGNQISKVFYEFAPSKDRRGALSPIDFAYLFKGCDKPFLISSDVKKNPLGEIVYPYDYFGKGVTKVFEMKCELYEGKTLIVPKNMMFETKLTLYMIMKTRSMLHTLKIEQPFIFEDKELVLPPAISQFIENAWCSEYNGPSSNVVIYKIKLPAKKEIWVQREFSAGNAGSSAYFTLALNKRDFETPQNGTSPKYRECQKRLGEFIPYPRENGEVLELFSSSKLPRLTCSLGKVGARLTNVKTYANLRQQAGNGRVIAQVPLGATVSVVNPGQFLRPDRCAATCNGTNQTAIKQCIDNNDVWIEVDYNGRRGFLSRKFLE